MIAWRRGPRHLHVGGGAKKIVGVLSDLQWRSVDAIFFVDHGYTGNQAANFPHIFGIFGDTGVADAVTAPALVALVEIPAVGLGLGGQNAAAFK